MIGSGLDIAAAIAAAAQPVEPRRAEPEPPPEQIAEIVVTGRAQRRIGAARAASEGSISGDELRIRPSSP